MEVFRIIFFGNMSSGKSQLVLQLMSDKTGFTEDLNPTVSVNFHSRTIDDKHKLQIWDISGDERYNSILNPYFKDASLGVFCVDLTEEIDEKQINEMIKAFRNLNANAPIILVGTKSDSPKANIDTFNRIKSKELFSDIIITSAKNRTKIEELLAIISKFCREHKKSQWQENVKKFLTGIDKLPEDKKTSIKKELSKLSKVILADEDEISITPERKAKAIEDFTRNCELTLEGKHSAVLNVVLSFAAFVAVTVVATLVGFGIGFALGCWSGPGAFISGLVGGSTAAVTVASSSTLFGAVAGGITAYGLFKPSKEMTALNEFANEASALNTGIYF